MKKAINIRNTLGLEDIAGTTFISVEMETPVKLTGGKSNSMQWRVTKHTITQGMIFNAKNKSAYESMVNRRLQKEGKKADFKVSPPAWGDTKVIPGIVEYTPKTGRATYYLEFIKTGSQKYEFRLDGKKIDPSRIEGLPAPRKSSSNQGLENTVEVRKVKLENILSLSANRRRITGPFTFE